MKRLDINITDSAHSFLDRLKKRTERSKTELVHDAIGLLSVAEKAYEADHEIAEVTLTGQVVSRIVLPAFQKDVHRVLPAPALEKNDPGWGMEIVQSDPTRQVPSQLRNILDAVAEASEETSQGKLFADYLFDLSEQTNS